VAFDAFITYASEDKDSIARPLALELRRRGWSVWFDEFELKVGDNVVGRINQGLAESRMIIVILSRAFPGKTWPKRELSAVMAREISESRSLLIPVLHEISATELTELLPALSNRLAINSAVGIRGMVDELERARQYSLDLLEPGRLTPARDSDGRPLTPDDPGKHAFDLSVTTFNDQLISHLAANPHRLYELTPRRFEELVAEIYSRSGFEVELTPASGDGGADVYAIRRDDLGSTLIVVQAKRYKPDLKVEASAVRELIGTVNLAQASAGVLITTSSFRPGAKKLAEQFEWRLSLKDYAQLQKLLKAPRISPAE
jgi:hypothetical protein